MADSRARAHLRRGLEVHVTKLGYSCVGAISGVPVPEVVRINPARGRVIYGETVVRRDLDSKRCHARLLFFSQRRTRHRGSILFFIAVATTDQQRLETLLAQLDIRSGIRGGHVHVVPIVPLRPVRGRRAVDARASAPKVRRTVRAAGRARRH